MADLITIEEFRDYLGLGVKASETKNDLMAECVSAASQWVREAVDRDIDLQEYEETYDGNGLPYLWLRQVPVATDPMPVVTENGTALVVAVGYDVSADVILDPRRGQLLRQGGPTQVTGNYSNLPNRWSIGFQNVGVAYSAGYATIPADLKSLTRYVAALYWKETDEKRVGIQRRSAGTHSTDFLRSLPDIYKQTIERRRRVYYAR